jgi:hypothetical protein
LRQFKKTLGLGTQKALTEFLLSGDPRALEGKMESASWAQFLLCVMSVKDMKYENSDWKVLLYMLTETLRLSKSERLMLSLQKLDEVYELIAFVSSKRFYAGYPLIDIQDESAFRTAKVWAGLQFIRDWLVNGTELTFPAYYKYLTQEMRRFIAPGEIAEEPVAAINLSRKFPTQESSITSMLFSAVSFQDSIAHSI